jgi:hypothetical protein
MAKLNISDLHPSIVERLVDTPAAGDRTIYVGYKNPTRQGSTLQDCVIEKILYIAATGTFTMQYAVTSGTNDQLDFNKVWANRASLSYKYLSF